MVEFYDFKDEELKTVKAIIKRAQKLYPQKIDSLDAQMDISAVSVHTPLRLDDWLEADDFNFAHDFSGINSCIDRNTGQLTKGFLPRFSR